ncbi:MAG: ABC transporter permease [Gammaproteobacteria bacterium]|nr:ABC transporter permease [Gammaproteobacteria bacterium]MCP5299253.1 ABC transporter permease [Chromatiaceae bacterium]
MSFQPVILWTDALVYLLLALLMLTVWHTRRHSHLKAPWRRVADRRIGQATMVLLSFYVVIGLLDTLHFHPRTSVDERGRAVYSTEVLSLFDVIAGPLRTQREKTYSAPFATHLFSKETVQLSDGSSARGFPRLQYGGAHLSGDGEGRLADIAAKALWGAAKGALLWVVLILPLCGFSLGRAARLLRGRLLQPWHIAAYAAFAVICVFSALWELAGYYHILGTDKVGEDVFFQSLKSIRTGLLIGTLTTLVMLPAAILLGIMAGYFRGWVDDLIQYLYTTLNSIPGVLLIAAAVLMMQIYMSNHADEFNSLTERADLRLLFLCLILGVTSWTSLCRLLRGEALKLRELEYVQAARAFGVGHFAILVRHILPNVMHIVLITIVLDFSGLVLAEAVLSYISIGVDPATSSWGNMINGARLELAREPVVWWSLLAAFGFMFTLVLAANLFSDVVRDAFDPRLREQR